MQHLWRTRALAGAALAALLLAAAGCGGSASTSSSGAGSGSSSTSSTGSSGAAASSASASSSSGTSGKTLNWTWCTLVPKGSGGFFFMAQHMGYFKKYGVNVTVKTFQGNLQETQAFVAGACDSADSAPGAMFKAYLKGAKIKEIGSTIPSLAYDIYSQKNIASVKDLKGKTIGASTPGSFPVLIVDAVLAKYGMSPNDVTVVSSGGDAQRYKALLAGKIDAMAGSPQFEPDVKKDGVKVLARIQNVVPNMPRFMMFATDKALTTKREAAVRYMAAMIEGITYAKNHPKAEEALTAQLIHSTPNNPSVVLDYNIQKNMVSTTCSPDRAKLVYFNNFAYAHHFIPQKVDLNKIIDPTIQQDALKLVKKSS